MKNIRDYLGYNRETGVFTWEVSPARNVKAGAVAGSVRKRTGYRSIQFDGRWYRANRLAWFFVYDKFPSLILDHRNGKRDDNRIKNLREATGSQNAQNRKSVRGSTSIYKGVTFHKSMRKWQAYITKSGRPTYLGLFDTEEAAARAYNAVAANEHGAFAKLNVVGSALL